MRIPKINLDFSKYSDSNLLVKANHILSSMTENAAVFPTPTPALADVQAAIATYSADLTAAAALGKVNVSNKNLSRNTLTDLLVQLGRYVTFIAAGDENILVMS